MKEFQNENNELLKNLFKDVSKLKMYSGEEQIELAKKAKEGDDIAREKLLNSNLRFVITQAKKYVGQGIPLIDLIQAGNLGLCLALENFEPERGYKFLSFAIWYIRREILKEIYNHGRTIRYPITYISRITKIKKEYEKFVADHSREPTEDELIDITNISQKQYDSVVMNKSYCQSIDSPVYDKPIDVIEPENPFTDTFTKEAISEVLKCLNKREYKVVTEFYGLEGNSEHTIKEIAQEMNLGDERVRQLRKEAIKKLKSRYSKTLKTLL